MFLYSLLVWLQATICIQTILQVFFPRSYAMIWFGFTAVSPLLAFVCWYAKGKSKLGIYTISADFGSMFNMCFVYGCWYLMQICFEVIVFILDLCFEERHIEEFCANGND